MQKFAISLVVFVAAGAALWLYADQNTTAKSATAASMPAGMAMPATASMAMPATASAPDAKPYPFATCVVDGMQLDPKTAITFVQDGYEVKVCDADDLAEFKAHSAVYMAKIKQAYQDAKPYPLKTCVVMGDALDDTAYSFVYEGRQFKLCCSSCLDDFQKDPDKYVKIWDNAAAKAAAAAPAAK